MSRSGPAPTEGVGKDKLAPSRGDGQQGLLAQYGFSHSRGLLRAPYKGPLSLVAMSRYDVNSVRVSGDLVTRPGRKGWDRVFYDDVMRMELFRMSCRGRSSSLFVRKEHKATIVKGPLAGTGDFGSQEPFCALPRGTKTFEPSHLCAMYCAHSTRLVHYTTSLPLRRLCPP